MKDPNKRKTNKNKNPHAFLPPFFGHTLSKIRREDDKGLLYYLDYHSNYYRLEKYLKYIAQPGCSTFLTKKKGTNEYLLGRNYDLVHQKNNIDKGWDHATGLCIVVRCSNPKAKYKSLGTLDGYWMDYKHGQFFEGALDDGKTNVTPMAMAPFVIMDGLNEAGLAVSIMHLATENEWTEIPYKTPEELTEEEKKHKRILEKHGEVPSRYDTTIKSGCITLNTADKKAWKVNKNFACHQTEPGKQEILHPVLLRRMVDFAATVDEAIEIAKSYNVVSPLKDNDYHIFVADKSGRSVILEWVNNKLNVVETNHGTNYTMSRKDKFGYGYDRDEVLVKGLKRYKDGMSEEEATEVLHGAAQDVRIKKFTSISQWSLLYNLTKGEMKIRVFMNFDKAYTYKIK